MLEAACSCDTYCVMNDMKQPYTGNLFGLMLLWVCSHVSQAGLN